MDRYGGRLIVHGRKAYHELHTTLAGTTVLALEARNEQEKVCAGKWVNLVTKTVVLVGLSVNEARKRPAVHEPSLPRTVRNA